MYPLLSCVISAKCSSLILQCSGQRGDSSGLAALMTEAAVVWYLSDSEPLRLAQPACAFRAHRKTPVIG